MAVTPPSSTPTPATWTVSRGAGQVTATFRGHLTTEEGERSVLAFVAELHAPQVRAVFDIREMTGYDAGARREWIKHLGPVRRQITEIELRGGNVLVRMGGAAMGAMLGIRVTTVE